jgi:hypothetical protein
MRHEGECTNCGAFRKIAAKGLCWSCYNHQPDKMEKGIRYRREHYAECKARYDAWRERNPERMIENVLKSRDKRRVMTMSKLGKVCGL